MEEFVEPVEKELVGLCPEEKESVDDLKSMKDFLGNNEKEGMFLSEELEFSHACTDIYDLSPDSLPFMLNFLPVSETHVIVNADNGR